MVPPIYGNPDIHPPKWTCSQSNLRIAADSQGFDLSIEFLTVSARKSGPWKMSISIWKRMINREILEYPMFNRFWLNCINSPTSNKLWVLGCLSVLSMIHPKNPRYAQTNQLSSAAHGLVCHHFPHEKKNILGVYLPRVRKKSRSIKTRFHIPFYSHQNQMILSLPIAA